MDIDDRKDMAEDIAETLEQIRGELWELQDRLLTTLGVGTGSTHLADNAPIPRPSFNADEQAKDFAMSNEEVEELGAEIARAMGAVPV